MAGGIANDISEVDQASQEMSGGSAQVNVSAQGLSQSVEELNKVDEMRVFAFVPFEFKGYEDAHAQFGGINGAAEIQNSRCNEYKR